jgi:hypothetical protein
MPRHPPCALHSLSQQRHKHTHSHAHARTPKTNHKKQQPTQPRQSQGRTGFTQSMTQPLQGKKKARSHKLTDSTRSKPQKVRTRLNCSNNTTPHQAVTPEAMSVVDARVHYADLKQQPHQPPPTPQGDGQAKGGPEATNHPSLGTDPSTGAGRLILQDPTVCLTPSPTNVRQRVLRLLRARQQADVRASTIPLVNTTIATRHSPVVGACAP